MSPLNRGPLMGPRIPPSMRPPMPRFGRAPPPGMNRGMLPPPMNPMFGPRNRPIPPPMPGSLRPGPMMARPGGPPGPPPPMFGPPRHRPLPPIPPMPPMGLRGPMGPHRGPMMRPGPRGMLPPHALPHMRPRFPPNHTNGKTKMNGVKKANKLEELELKKPWMTDEIRSEIQKKNKLYAKAKKNKDAKEWEEFKDLRNKVTRMIRDAKNEYLAKNPDQVAQKTADKSTVQKESVQKTENTTEQTEQTELNGENKPSSEQAHLHEQDEEMPEVDAEEVAEFLGVGSADEAEEPVNPYCEVCDRDFDTRERLERHVQEHRTCKIDGCTFTAHPKIVDKHIGMQHSTGLYERMKHVMSEEDVEKWRAERKRRYPTAETIKQQEDERLEKKKRGEVIRSQKENQRIQNPSKREHVRRIRKRKRNKPFQMEFHEKPIERKIYRGLPPFAGTAMLDEIEQSDNSSVEEETVAEAVPEEAEEKCKFEVSDEDEEIVQKIDEQIVQEPTVTEVPKPTTALPPTIAAPKMLGLVADYGSDSDDDEPPDEVPINKSKPDDEVAHQPEPQTESTKVVASIKTTLDSKASSSTSKEDKKSIVKDKQNYEDRRKPNRPQKRNNSEFNNGRLRLLNKLLARSIQHERNAMHQCITFIANNNFFD